MSWDRKGDRRVKYIKRKKSKTNSKSKRFKRDKNSHDVSIGQFGKIINILKSCINVP